MGGMRVAGKFGYFGVIFHVQRKYNVQRSIKSIVNKTR